jgi:hypothetical protein
MKTTSKPAVKKSPAAALAVEGPKLKTGNDASVALELGRLVRDAMDGTRRIVIAGLFLETIAENLPHGQLGPWIEAHEEEIGAKRVTIFKWRQFAAQVVEAAGVKKYHTGYFSAPLHEVLALADAEVPADARKARAAIDALIEGKSKRTVQMELGLVEAAPRGGKTHDPKNRARRRTKAEVTEERGAKEAADCFPLFMDQAYFVWFGPRLFQHLGDDELAAFTVQMERLAKDAKEIATARLGAGYAKRVGPLMLAAGDLAGSRREALVALKETWVAGMFPEGVPAAE